MTKNTTTIYLVILVAHLPIDLQPRVLACFFLKKHVYHSITCGLNEYRKGNEKIVLSESKGMLQLRADR